MLWVAHLLPQPPSVPCLEVSAVGSEPFLYILASYYLLWNVVSIAKNNASGILLRFQFDPSRRPVTAFPVLPTPVCFLPCNLACLSVHPSLQRHCKFLVGMACVSRSLEALALNRGSGACAPMTFSNRPEGILTIQAHFHTGHLCTGETAG